MKTLFATVLLVPALLLSACARLAAPGEPAVQHAQVEDDAVKIDELRVRGQVQRLQVTPKTAGAPAYEIVPDRRQNAGTASGTHDATGQRVWTLLSF
jgi:hypothetical protein